MEFETKPTLLPRAIGNSATSKNPNEALLTTSAMALLHTADEVCPVTLRKKEPQMKINKNLKFYNFRENPGNRMAKRAAEAITAGSVLSFNPLFLYGKENIGKTHLLNAIGNDIEMKTPEAVVLLTSADALFLAAEEAIEQGNVDFYHEMYESPDYLLIDDMNEIPDTRAAEEVTAVIRNLVKGNKMVVITSKFSPKEIPGFTDQYRVLLNNGFIVDLVQIV